MRYRVGDIVKQTQLDHVIDNREPESHFVVTKVMKRGTEWRYCVFWLERGYHCDGDYSLQNLKAARYVYEKVKGDY